MIEQFQDEKALLQWVDDRLRETQTTRQERAGYANRCRAYYNGIHWLQRGVGPDGFMRLYYNERSQWLNEYDANEPMRVTMNQITQVVLGSAAATNWTGMEVSSLRSHNAGTPESVVDADIIESVANMVVETARLKNPTETANFERCIDAMHGVGVRLQRGRVGELVDLNLRAFDFDGYQLALDPTEKSSDLRDHEYVIFTEVMTLHAAERDFGSEVMAAIDRDKLQTVAQLLPTEMAFHGLSGGRMYTHLSQASSQKAVRVHRVWLKGVGKRFDRMYLIVDGIGPAGKRVVNFGNPSNPFGGCGMPLQLLVGFKRPTEVFPISDVGMMIDDQDRLNATASLFFQQMWDYTTNYIVAVDKGWFGDSRATDADIMAKARTGYWIGQTNGQARFQPPQIVQRPAPNQGLEVTMERFRGDIRSSAFQSDLHAGMVKTHVPDRTNQMALELVEAPIDDRRDGDVRAITALVEVAVGTVIRAAQAQSPSIIMDLQEAGLNSTQIGRLLSMNPDRLPVALQINRESVRRRSRGQQKRDLVEIAQYGAHMDPVLRQAMSELDYPIMEDDKSVERWANEAVARLMAGDMWDAIPFGINREAVLTALRRGMMSEMARADQNVMAALKEAFDMQLQVEGLLMPPEEQAAPPAGPQEMTLDDIFAGVGQPPV